MKIALIVLAVLLALLLIPFGAVVRYDQTGLNAWAKVLSFRFRVFPAPPKKEKPKRKKAEAKKPAPKKSEPKEEPPKKGGKLDLVRSALPLVKPALAGLKKRLTIRDLELHVTWAAADPAGAATGYGYANAALGTLWAVVDENFKVKKSRLGCSVDFDGDTPTVFGYAELSINLWKTLTLVLPLLVRFTRNYTRLTKARAEKTKKEA